MEQGSRPQSLHRAKTSDYSVVERLRTATEENSDKTPEQNAYCHPYHGAEAYASIPYELIENGSIAVVSLGSSDATMSPFGTNAAEHRLTPALVLGFLQTLETLATMPDVLALVVSADGKFWCNGFDLNLIKEHPSLCDPLQQSTELLCSQLLKYPKVTIAAVNGHATAAGAMLMLSFDYTIMNSQRGYCFVPGIDLGLVYSPGMSELMKAKLPIMLWRDFVIFGERFTCPGLEKFGVVEGAGPEEVFDKAVEKARKMKNKAKHGETLSRIKETLYHEAVSALELEVDELVVNPHCKYKYPNFDLIKP